MYIVYIFYLPNKEEKNTELTQGSGGNLRKTRNRILLFGRRDTSNVLGGWEWNNYKFMLYLNSVLSMIVLLCKKQITKEPLGTVHVHSTCAQYMCTVHVHSTCA